MKVVITGSKKSCIKPGIHKMNHWLHEYFSQFDLVQISRATGYDFDTDYDKAVEVARTADIFVNSACVKDYQVKFLNDVYGHVPTMICLGSIAGDMFGAPQKYDNHPNYPEVKHELKERCKWIQLEKQDAKTNLLHLNITETKEVEWNTEGLDKDQLFNTLDFWLNNQYISNIGYKFWSENYGEQKLAKVKGIVDYFKQRKE